MSRLVFGCVSTGRARKYGELDADIVYLWPGSGGKIRGQQTGEHRIRQVSDERDIFAFKDLPC